MWPAFWEIRRQVKKQQLEPDMGQQTVSKVGKEYIKAVYFHTAYLMNFYAEYIMWNARLDEVEAGIKIARRNINNLRYAFTTLRAESEEELTSLLMKVKEEGGKAGLKTQHSKSKIMASGPITSWQINGETIVTVTDFILGGLWNHCKWCLQPWN